MAGQRQRQARTARRSVQVSIRLFPDDITRIPGPDEALLDRVREKTTAVHPSLDQNVMWGARAQPGLADGTANTLNVIFASP